MKRPQFRCYSVVVNGKRYRAECRVVAPRKPAHAGADSPHFLYPGTRGSVRIIAILDGSAHWCYPADMDAYTVAQIQRSVEEQAGVTVMAMPRGEREPALPFDVESAR